MEPETIDIEGRAGRSGVSAVAALGLLLMAIGVVYDVFAFIAVMRPDIDPELYGSPIPAWVDALVWLEYLVPLGVLLLCIALVVRRRQFASDLPGRAESSSLPAPPWAFFGIVALAFALLFVWPDRFGPYGLTVALTVASFAPALTFASRTMRTSWSPRYSSGSLELRPISPGTKAAV